MSGWRKVALRLAGAGMVFAGAVHPAGAQIAKSAPPARSPEVPFVPTQNELVRSMLEAARVGPSDTVYDLGCGDGRIVITAVRQYGAKRGVCVDIDPQRIAEARHNADTAGVADKIEFSNADLFQTDLREATVVTLYLLPLVNERLRPKLFRELRPGSRVVSNSFDMGTWGADSTISPPAPSGFQRVAYFWVIPADVAGVWRIRARGDGVPRSVEIEQTYQRLNGTAKVGGRTVPLPEVRITGERLAFRVGNTAELAFEGVVRGDQITGTFTDATGARKEWSAERTKRGARRELRE